MKKIITCIFTAILCFSFTISTFAQDNKLKLSNEEKQQLTLNMESLGITDKKTQKSLIKKIENGELLDSVNPDKIAEVPEELLTPTKDSPVVTYTFPDGSVIKNSVEKVGIGIQGCGTGYCNYYEYKVRAEAVVIAAQYYVDFTINQGTSTADRILRVYNQTASATGVAIISQNLSITRAVEDIPNKLKASSNYKIVYGTMGGQLSAHLKFNVGQDSYSVSPQGF